MLFDLPSRGREFGWPARQIIFPQTVLALRGSYGVGKAGAMACLWLRSRPPPLLKPCNLQYKMDLTLKNPSVSQEINGNVAVFIIFSIQNQLFSSQMSPWQPLGSEV